MSNKIHGENSQKIAVFVHIMFQCYFFFQILSTAYCDTGKERDCTGAASRKYEIVTMRSHSVLMAYGERGGKPLRILDQDINGDKW
jgi:hypothetical protein